jgi:hypothetical protein
MVAIDTEESREQLWHRLSSESARAYEAYKVYMYLSPAERTVVGSWRLWSHNTDTKREPPFFRSWYHSYAWSERARPHDHHIELLREEGQEEAIKEEAARQAQKVEKTRARLNELRAMAYERAIECLESDDFVEQLRPSDVRQILNIHLETTQKLGGGETGTPDGATIVDWSEDEQRELDNLLGEIETGEGQEKSSSGSENSEVDPEEAEGEQD